MNQVSSQDGSRQASRSLSPNRRCEPPRLSWSRFTRGPRFERQVWVDQRPLETPVRELVPGRRHIAQARLVAVRLAKALVAIHERPAQRWDLHQLAATAGMSRSHFSASFHEIVGQTPADYLARHRICVAQDLLRLGRSLQQAADAVGYGSSAALSRAFTHYCAQSPREWRRLSALEVGLPRQ